jgi:uncharacterized protein (TIGR00296 family)
MDYSLEDGAALIAYARKNIEHYLKTKERLSIPPELAEKFRNNAGAFVTLNKYHGPHETTLRGCIGHILPDYPLIQTVHEVSIYSAVDDPRFPPVKLDELSQIVIEISILTIPEKIIVQKPEDYFKEIVIGRDGLIVTKGMHRGLLLPQVPLDHDRNWDVETFLEHTCSKAWLPEDAWKDIKNVTIERFTAIIFEETAPNGSIRRKKIGE